MKKIIVSLFVLLSCSQLQRVHENMVMRITEDQTGYRDCIIVKHEGNTLYSRWIAVCNNNVYSCYYYDVDSKIIKCEAK